MGEPSGRASAEGQTHFRLADVRRQSAHSSAKEQLNWSRLLSSRNHRTGPPARLSKACLTDGVSGSTATTANSTFVWASGDRQRRSSQGRLPAASCSATTATIERARSEKRRPWLGCSPGEQEQNVIVKRTQPLQRGQALFLDRDSGFIAEGGDTGAL